MCCVMPPASPAATSVSRIASSSERLAVVDVAHDRDHGRAVDQVLVAVLVGRVGLGVLGRADHLDLLAERLGEHLDGLVGQGLGERRHLAQLHQLLDHLGGAQLERLGDLLDGGAGADRDGRVLRLLGLQLRLRLRLEIRLDPLGPAPAAATAARRLGLLGRRGPVAPGGLGVDHHAPAPATTAAVAGSGLAAAAARGTRAAAATLTAAGRTARVAIAARTAVGARTARAAGTVGTPRARALLVARHAGQAGALEAGARPEGCAGRDPPGRRAAPARRRAAGSRGAPRAARRCAGRRPWRACRRRPWQAAAVAARACRRPWPRPSGSWNRRPWRALPSAQGRLRRRCRTLARPPPPRRSRRPPSRRARPCAGPPGPPCW